MTHPRLLVLVGLQASGKTTFFRRNFASTHQHVSKDNFPNARNRDTRQALLLDRALAEGRSVVLDNTNATPGERQRPISIARAHGARIVGYYFESTPRTSLVRNRLREGKARVPDVAIFATAKRLVPPRYEEGFDEIYKVKLMENGEFQVTPIDRRTG